MVACCWIWEIPDPYLFPGCGNVVIPVSEKKLAHLIPNIPDRVPLYSRVLEYEKAKIAAEHEVAQLKLLIFKPIEFRDAVGRKFRFPWKICKTWKVSISNIING